MKAKKIFLTALFVAIGILCVNSVKAEGDSPNSGNDRKTGTVTVNINLHAVQSLIINPTHDKVDIDYMNAADYKNGVSVEKTDHLIVFSTGGIYCRRKF